MKKLPNKLSKLILMALEDLETLENTPGFKIDMNVWVEKKYSNEYAVCLAGVVMSLSLDALAIILDALAIIKEANYALITPQDFGMKNAYKLYALNSVTTGRIGVALSQFYLDGSNFNANSFIKDVGFDQYPVAAYHVNRILFKNQMQDIAGILAGEGL